MCDVCVVYVWCMTYVWCMCGVCVVNVCDMSLPQYNGWTLISSFVNDEHLSWGGNTQKVKENWQGIVNY